MAREVSSSATDDRTFYAAFRLGRYYCCAMTSANAVLPRIVFMKELLHANQSMGRQQVPGSPHDDWYGSPGGRQCARRETALVHEHVCRFDALRCIAALEHLEAGEFVPLQVVAAVVAAFKSAHGDGALGQVNVVPAQIASLADPKPMTVDQQADQRLGSLQGIAP